MDLQKEREAFELVVANKLQNSLYHSVFFNEATGYDCADDAPAAVQFFCCGLNSDWRIWKAAKAQAAPEGFVVVPVGLSESIAEKLALEKVEKPRQENDVVWQEIADHSYKDHLIQKKWEIIRNYKELVEAVRGGNE